ncbi:hypothetical protein B0I35DRAFT_267378 [Stachybotrys elegans]|uniref:Uncharacterized protein n=1 Tax=Stachybotrys elegans TaxID=80388 RepID=A0A8K0SQG9_9HYPO|nr:hypothetical protein B0I35DRAFT_267378 [Stachybotrys elegans]
MEFDDLCLAIIRRSLPTVRRLLAAEYTESRNYPGELNPVSLSVGWPEGLTIIVKHGFDVYSALEFACQLDDVQSASILLTSERAIFKDMWTLKATRNNTRIFALVVAELRNCREAVKSLALQNLTMSEQNAVGLTHALQHDDLDLPPELFTVLSKKMRVSEKLDCLRMRSPYCYCYAWSERSPDSAHILYDAGFTNLDTPCMHGKPPLAVCSRQSILDWSSYDDEWRGLCLWILEKGAQDLGPPHPPFMFYVAFWYRRRHVSPYLDTERLRHLKNWFIRDKCNCFCSTYGCIAPFWLWRCCIGGDSYFHMECKSGHLGRYSNLREWIKTSRASKKATEFCYSEIMRLEIFERLGMAHTCCKAHDADESEQQEFREEDRASQRQLQFFCKVYQNLRIRLSDWPIDRFWADWWQAVDLILPPLSPWESCNDFYGRYDPVPVALERDREDFMEKSLSEAGFGGWDFDDVILHQLNRLLQSARAWRGRRRCWQSHRLMAKPTMQLSGCRASREWKQYSCYNIYIPVRTSSEVSSSVGF